MLNMDALLAAKRAERAAKGLIAENGVACATAEDRDWLNARDAAKREGRRDAATTAHLMTLKAAAVAAHGRA